MKGHGEKISRKMEAAVIALLTAPNIAAAAKETGIGETTLWRWMQDEGFRKKYDEAKTAALSQAIAQIQQATGAAVKTLLSIATDESAPASSRVSAAKTLLELAFKAKETEDLEARIDALEREFGKGRRSG